MSLPLTPEFFNALKHIWSNSKLSIIEEGHKVKAEQESYTHQSGSTCGQQLESSASSLKQPHAVLYSPLLVTHQLEVGYPSLIKQYYISVDFNLDRKTLSLGFSIIAVLEDEAENITCSLALQ